MKTVRIGAILAVALALLLLTAGAVLADSPAPQLAGKSAVISGLVTAKGAKTFDVRVAKGAHQTTSLTVTVTVSDTTRFFLPGKRDATFADLVVGDKVTVMGRRDSNTFTARQVQIAPRRPVMYNVTGTVTEYTAGSITVKLQKGAALTFTINGATRIRYPKGVTQITVGDKVSVQGEQAWGETAIVAKQIVVVKSGPPTGDR